MKYMLNVFSNNFTLSIVFVFCQVVIFSGCKKEEEEAKPAPGLTFVKKDGYITNDVTVKGGEAVKVAWEAKKGGASLKEFIIYENGNINPTFNQGSGAKKISGEIYQDEATLNAPMGGASEFKFLVTDEDGQSVSQTIKVSVQTVNNNNNNNNGNNNGGGGTPLGQSLPLVWQKEGTLPSTGVGEVGLKWTANPASNQTAIIRKDKAVKLVELTEAFWTGTSESLKSAVDSGTDLISYNGVPTISDGGEIDDYLGIQVDTQYYIIHVKSSTSSTGPNGGVLVTVQTEYKK